MDKCPHCNQAVQDGMLVCSTCGGKISPQKALITIAWKDMFTGLVEKLGLFLDSQKVDEISLMQTIQFEVEPGEHVLFVKMDFSESPKKKISIHPGETLNFAITSKGKSGIGSMYYMLFNPKNQFFLAKLDGSDEAL